MSVLPDELSTIQKRVDALKNKPAKPEKPKRPFPRKGSKFIDGVYYAPEEVERLGLSSGNKSRNNNGKPQPARTRAALQGDERVAGATTTELDRRDTRHSRSGEGQPADHERSDADYDEPVRDGRKTESETRDRHARLDSGDNSAEGIAARVSKGAKGAVNNAFQWMAGLGKPGEDNEGHDGPSSGNGFHPVEHVANFLDEEYARPFTEKEASESEQEVIDMIVGYSYDLDDFLTLSNAHGDVSTIWRMDSDEAAPIARLWLKRAKKDKRAAATLRLAMQGDDYKRAAIVLGPRMWRTATWYPNHGGWKMQPWENRNRES